MIYLDNAATTLRKPEAVIEAVADAMRNMGNSGRGSGSTSLRASRVIYEARRTLTEFFGGTDPSRLVFTSNSTEGLNMAIRGIFVPGDHVITTELEHNSVLRPLYGEQEQNGISLTIVKSGKQGTVDYEGIEAAIRPETRAVICTHASNLTGNVVNLYRMGQIAKRNGLLFVVDASQTAGVLPLDIERMQIDVLCFTGHKGLMGPQGTGGMIVQKSVHLPAFKTGGSGVQSFLKTQPKEMPTVLEAGTLNGHGIAGLHAALNYILNVGTEQIKRIECQRMRQFYEGIKHLDAVKIYGDFSNMERAPIVALNIGNYDSSAVSDELSEVYGIQTRPGAHCAPLMHRALHTEEQGIVRFSFSHFLSEEQVEEAVQAIKEMTAGEEI